jgi:hypothetical protein
VVESNNAPSINTLTNIFFIDFSPRCAKITDCKFPLRFLYPIQSIDFNGNFRIWNRFFPKWEPGGGWNASCSLEHSQVKTVDLLKSHFGTVLEEIFHFIDRTLIEDCLSHSGCISCYRIAKNGCECAEICRRRPASGDDSKKPPWRGFRHPGFLIFVTFQPRTFQTLFSAFAIFYYGNRNARFPTLGKRAEAGPERAEIPP